MPRTTQRKTLVNLCHVVAYSGIEANSAHYPGTIQNWVVWFDRDGSHVQPYTTHKRRVVIQNQCGGDWTTRGWNSAHLPLRYWSYCQNGGLWFTLRRSVSRSTLQGNRWTLVGVLRFYQNRNRKQRWVFSDSYDEKNSIHFMDPRVSLLCSQEPATCPYSTMNSLRSSTAL